jgi:hypothetical protein
MVKGGGGRLRSKWKRTKHVSGEGETRTNGKGVNGSIASSSSTLPLRTGRARKTDPEMHPQRMLGAITAASMEGARWRRRGTRTSPCFGIDSEAPTRGGGSGVAARSALPTKRRASTAGKTPTKPPEGTQARVLVAGGA